MDNMKIYNSVRKPPATSLKQIKGGRLSGMTDINPQWRYEALTEQFGPCGIRWKFTIDNKWMEQGSDNQIVGFADISLYIKVDDKWSEAIPGTGGSTFVAKESKGMYTSDEVYKMAVTDALSTACKMIGIGADIYAGKWDGSNYKDEPKQQNDTKKTPSKEKITELQAIEINDLLLESGGDEVLFMEHFGISKINDMPLEKYNIAISMLKAKLKKVKESE